MIKSKIKNIFAGIKIVFGVQIVGIVIVRKILRNLYSLKITTLKRLP